MKTKIIVNKLSASGQCGKKWPNIEKQLQDKIGDFEVEFTTHENIATSLTRNALQNGYERIIAVGGDGTMNEVVNGFFDKAVLINKEAVFSFVMVGTGGDFQKSFNVFNVDQAIENVANIERQKIDIGEVKFVDHQGNPQIRYFCNIASIGMTAEAGFRIKKATFSKWLGKTWTYLWATLKTLILYNNKKVTLKVDSQPEQQINTRFIAFANCNYFAGGMKVAPNAVKNDGLIDIVIASNLNLFKTMINFTKIYKGTHLQVESFSNIKGKQISVTSDEEVFIELDGETPGKLPMSIKMLPSIINVI